MAQTTQTPSGAGRRAPATPLARAVAADLGVDLAAVTGSGRGGRVLRLAGGGTPHAEWTDPAHDFAEILAVAEPDRFAP